MRSDIKKMMDYCTYCPKMCRFSCPVSEAAKTETVTPWGKMELAGWLLDKEVPWSPEAALPAYQCTLCLHCQQYCEHDNDVPSSLREIRRLAVENYTAPPAVYELQRRFAAQNNPYGRDLLTPLKAEVPKAFGKKKKDVALLLCCHTSNYFPSRLKTYLDLFAKLGVESCQVFDGPVQCCGAPLRALGLDADFAEIAEVQACAFQDYSYLVTDGPECAYALRETYRRLGFPLMPQVLHLLEFLAPFLKHHNYRSKGRITGRFAYHDPVFLSRYLKILDLPREILQELTGSAPVELSQHGEDSLSSGGEGGYDWVFPDLSEKIARRTADEVASRELTMLITACSKSEERFRRVARGFEVRDLYEFLNEHLLKRP
jgi:Fe-S oxidoreductase